MPGLLFLCGVPVSMKYIYYAMDKPSAHLFSLFVTELQRQKPQQLDAHLC